MAQRIGLTDVKAVVQGGKIIWENHCLTEGGRIRVTESTSKRLISEPREWALARARYYRSHAIDQFKALFLPVGYPRTVKPNYERYAMLSALQNVLQSTNIVLSSAFLLYAVGLGAGAVPVAGALNWLIKDGVGQAGTLIFGRVIAHDFDINTRTWNFLSNVAINVACAVEISCVWRPEHFLLVASAANTLKGVACMAGSSTRAAFNISFAKGENIADITAKSTSQYICTSIMGSVAGIAISSQVGSDATAALVVSGALAAANAFITFATIRSVPLSNLNPTRMQLLADHYLKANAEGHTRSAVPLPRPSQLCASDPVLHASALALDHRFEPAIEVNTPLSQLLHPNLERVAAKVSRLLALHRDARHLLMRDGRRRDARLHVILHEDATPSDAVVAMMHAVLLRREVKKAAQAVLTLEEELQLIRTTLATALRHREPLIASIREARWNMDRVCIETRASRAVW